MVQQRYVMCGMTVLAITVSLGSRFGFSLILAQMVFIPNLNQTTSQTHEIICSVNAFQEPSLDNHTSTKLNINDDRFQWSQEVQGIILSSFNWGYSIAMFLSGILVQKYGSKLVLLVSLFLSAIMIILTPLAVTYGDVIGLMIARAVTGFFQAPLVPCLSVFYIAWFPVEQRGRFSGITAVGFGIGGFFVSYFTGIILGYIERWDLAFYFHGSIIILYCILIPFLFYDRPQLHPFIGQEEKQFLAKKIDYLHEENNLPVPWGKVFTSRPIIAFCIILSLKSWPYNVINYNLPKYMNDVVHIPMKKNALYSSLPYILTIISNLLSGILCDWMLKKGGFSLTKIRKIFVTISSIIPGMFLVGASYAGCDEVHVIICFSFALCFTGFNIVGLEQNLLDLAPNFVAPLAGLLNSFQMFSAVLAHYIIGVLTSNAYLSEWRLVLWLTFGCLAAVAIIFLLFGTAEIQPWNDLKKVKDNETKDELLS